MEQRSFPELKTIKRTGIGFLATSFLTLGVYACGLGNTVTAPAGTGPVGTWELVRVNNSALPVTLTSREDVAIEILSEDILLRVDQSYATFTVEKFGSGANATAADTVNNLGYWGVTSGDLLIGITPATQRGDTLTIRSNARGLSVYARR